MAFTPYFGISPNTVLSLIGLIKGPDKTVATPVADWRQAKVDVVIPTLNEERNIPICRTITAAAALSIQEHMITTQL